MRKVRPLSTLSGHSERDNGKKRVSLVQKLNLGNLLFFQLESRPSKVFFLPVVTGICIEELRIGRTHIFALETLTNNISTDSEFGTSHCYFLELLFCK